MNPKAALYVLTMVAIVVVLVSAWSARRRSRARNTRAVPEEYYNALVTDIDVLHPDDPPLDVPATAGHNVMRITEDYLFVRTASGTMFGGRSSMSWWATFLTTIILLFPLMDILDVFHRIFVSGIGFNKAFYISKDDLYGLYGFLFWCVAMSWIFVGWRRQLPIIFNRKARTVTCWVEGKARTRNWDEVKAYSKGAVVVAYGGASGHEGYLHIVVDHWFNPKTQKMQEVCANIYQTEGVEFRGSRGAEAIWEYIRLYMDKGPGALPFPLPKEVGFTASKYMLDHWSEAFTGWIGKSKNPSPSLSPSPPPPSFIGIVVDTFRTDGFFGGISLLFCCVFFFLVGVFFYPIAIPTDLFYMVLDRILPRRKWPKELLEACNYTWDGANDHGPLSEPALKAFDFEAARKAYAASSEIRG